MPSIITHSLVGIAAGKAFAPKGMPRRFWDLTIICAILPDLDVIFFRFGVEYGHFLGHRGFFHSPFFALLLAISIVLIFYRTERRWWAYLIYFFLITAANGILDAFTNGGLGVALLSPFSNKRYFFPWRPIVVSPIGARWFFTRWGLRALMSEVIWVWIPAFFVVLVARVGRNYWGRFRRT